MTKESGMPNDKSTVIGLRNNDLGDAASLALGQEQGASSLASIADADSLPNAMCSQTDGVKPACKGLSLQDFLRSLESRGP
jgi:hypothetical protein